MFNVHTFMFSLSARVNNFKEGRINNNRSPELLKPEDVQIRPGRCTFRRDTLGPSG